MALGTADRPGSRPPTEPATSHKQCILPNKRRRVEGIKSFRPASRQSRSAHKASAPHQSAHLHDSAGASLYRNTGAGFAQELPACLQPFVTDASQWWVWKYNSKIHYRKQGDTGPVVLLIHGFGVGAFHFEQLLSQLSSSCQVWAVDLLGQGMSWPSKKPTQGR